MLNSLQYLDLAIVLAFVAVSVLAGFAARRRASRNLDEYFLGGRTIKGWRAGVSMAATQYAADTPLLVAGLVAVGGVFSLWQLWVYGLAFLLLGFVLGAAWRRAAVLTDAELTTERYSGRGVLGLRVTKAIYYGTLINCVVMAFVLLAATRIFEIFLPWHDWLPAAFYRVLLGLGGDIATTNTALSITLVLGFVALYSATGGLRSVITTDVMQFALMMVGTAIYAWYSVAAAGGTQAMLDGLVTQYGEERAARMLSFTPPAAEALVPFLIILSLQWLFQVNSDGTGYLAQRVMACASDRDARVAAMVFTTAQVLVRSLLWLPIAIALLVIYPFDATAPAQGLAAAREITFVQGINDLLPAGARGLMLTGMLAALASTLDTHLNWGASYWSNDLYKALWVERWQRRIAKPRELVLVARLSNVVIISLALYIMVHLDSIQRAWQISLLFGAGIGGVLVLRWVWERINLYCEVAAMLVSIVLAPILLATVDAFWMQLLVMVLASTATVVITAYWAPPTDRTQLIRFFERVRPPGFWQETATAAGEDPRDSRRELRRGLLPVAAAACSIYGLLIGVGLLILHPGDWLLSMALIAAGLLAAPFWLRRL